MQLNCNFQLRVPENDRTKMIERSKAVGHGLEDEDQVSTEIQGWAIFHCI